MKQKVLNDIANFVPSKNTEEYNEIFNVISNPFINVKTEYFRLQTLENIGVLIRPKQVVVGERLNDRLQNGRVMLEPKTVNITTIPLRFIFKNILQHSNFFDVILEYLKYVKDNNDPSIIYRFLQSTLWKEKIKGHDNKIILPLFCIMMNFKLITH